MPALPNSRRWSEFALIALALAFIAGWFAPLGWPFELFVHFRLQLLVAAAALGILLLLLRRPVLAVVALGLALPLLVTSCTQGPSQSLPQAASNADSRHHSEPAVQQS